MLYPLHLAPFWHCVFPRQYVGYTRDILAYLWLRWRTFDKTGAGIGQPQFLAPPPPSRIPGSNLPVISAI